MMRRTLSATLAACVIALGLAPLGTTAQAPMGSSPPDDAVAAYVEAIASGDVDAILAASAADDMAAGFDFTAYTERLQAMMLTTGLAPTEYPLFAEANRYQQAALLLGQVRNLVYGLLSDETIDGTVIAPVDEARAQAFVSTVDPSRLAGLTVLDSRFPVAEMATNERYLTNAAAQAAIYGADELTERLALLDLDGQTYALGLTLLRYGDDWRVASQSSPLAGTTALGTAEPMTREEFDAQTGG